MVDIFKQEIDDINEVVFNILLKDRTTRNNICWATDNYESRGLSFYPQEPITKSLISGINKDVVQPRILKSISEQSKRTKDKAEVFTPSWICNEQNNLIDEAWFGKKNVFNEVTEFSWKATKNKVKFPADKTWHDYVKSKRLEITCGEAPYLVSRYDTVTGEKIPIEERIGILDRKLRIVSENTESEADWFKWVIKAYESTYGYEYQGDNILIARKNLLYTFIEYRIYKFISEPTLEQLKKIARIISWNIWQMDGVTMTVPFSEKPKENVQLSLFDFMEGIETKETESIPCRIYDWRSNESIEFRSMIKEGV